MLFESILQSYIEVEVLGCTEIAFFLVKKEAKKLFLFLLMGVNVIGGR